MGERGSQPLDESRQGGWPGEGVQMQCPGLPHTHTCLISADPKNVTPMHGAKRALKKNAFLGFYFLGAGAFLLFFSLLLTRSV